MDFYLETAPVSASYGFAAAFEPRKPPRSLLVEQTEFATSIDIWADFFADDTGVRAPTAVPGARTKFSLVHTPTVSEAAVAPPAASPAPAHAALLHQVADVDGIAKQRVQLMAAKYAGGEDESSEIVARLEILNRRLSAAAPRVSEAQVSALENANERLALIRSAREERSARLDRLVAST